MENRNYYTITLTLLGALKLILNGFGVNLFTDQNENDIANAVATLLTAAGVIMTHLKGHPSFIESIFSKFKKKNTVPVEQPKQVETPVQNAPVLKENAPVITVAPSTQSTEQPAPAPTNNTVQK